MEDEQKREGDVDLTQLLAGVSGDEGEISDNEQAEIDALFDEIPAMAGTPPVPEAPAAPAPGGPEKKDPFGEDPLAAERAALEAKHQEVLAAEASYKNTAAEFQSLRCDILTQVGAIGEDIANFASANAQVQFADDVATAVGQTLNEKFTQLQQAEAKLEQERTAFVEYQAAEQKKLDEQEAELEGREEECDELETSSNRWFNAAMSTWILIGFGLLIWWAWPTSHIEVVRTPDEPQSQIEQLAPPSEVEQAVEEEAEVAPPADIQQKPAEAPPAENEYPGIKPTF